MTTHPHLEGLYRLAASWRDESAKLRKQGGRAQRRGDLADADVAFTAAQDANAYADELEAALAALPGGGVDEETKS